jgi:uncharacterized protein involved in exopolysaccharide biosynthesis
MTRTHWILVGAIGLGVAVGLYLLFFCPTDSSVQRTVTEQQRGRR